jgi:hypothetical protein
MSNCDLTVAGYMQLSFMFCFVLFVMLMWRARNNLPSKITLFFFVKTLQRREHFFVNNNTCVSMTHPSSVNHPGTKLVIGG